MFVRYFAQTDTSHSGAWALSYLEAMLSITKAVRVVPVGDAGFTGRWVAYQPLALTPRTDDYISVVCASPSRWAWSMTYPMPNKDGSTSAARSDVELHTAGKHNVLIIPRGTYPKSTIEMATAKKYDAVLVGSDTDRAWWWSNNVKQAKYLRLPEGEWKQRTTDELKAAMFPTAT